MKKGKFYIILKTLRVNQWIKNLVVFTAVIFSGHLFELDITLTVFYAFLVFCLLSSASYVLNDIIDYPYDKKHPVKKNRPIASGKISIPEATFILFILSIFSLVVSLFFSVEFFLLCFIFLLLHFFYSLYLKKKPVIDIFVISFSFMMRAFAGEIVSGWHIPIWLILTIFFGSLFMAAIKRQAELSVRGRSARESLFNYKANFLDFLTYTFATTTIISYSFYTYLEKPPVVQTVFTDFFKGIFPDFEARKWFMITIPLIVYGIARYAQLLYEKAEGERPEKIVTTDIPLLATIILWGVTIVSLIYIF